MPPRIFGLEPPLVMYVNGTWNIILIIKACDKPLCRIFLAFDLKMVNFGVF